MKNLLLLVFVATLISISTLYSQTEEPTIVYEGSGSYWMVERSDLRRYDNGRYTGLTQREIRSFVHPITAPPQRELKGDSILIASKNAGVGSWFDGSFFVAEKTLSNQRQTALGLDGAIPATFFISPDGTLIPIVDNGFPTFRSFPAFPEEVLKPGDTWIADSYRSVDPLNKGVYTKLKMTVQYTFVGEEVYLGEEVFRIRAQWATRYGQTYWDFGGDQELKQANGSHKANIIVLKDTGAAILIQDTVDETFVYHNGQTVQFRGSINLFTEFPPAVNTEDILPALGKIASIAPGTGTTTGESSLYGAPSYDSANANDSATNNQSYGYPDIATESFSANDLPSSNKPLTSDGAIGSTNGSLAQNTDTGVTSNLPLSPQVATNNMVVEETPAGLRLSVRNIQFLPDSAEFSENEFGRLDLIADTLIEIPNAQFLVEGHSASTGNPRGEKQLSIERAQTIVRELVKRGIDASRFVTNGHGSENPIASNETFEGREANRRVEITILE